MVNPISQNEQKSEARSARPFRLLYALQSVGTAAIIIATLFTLWSPANLLSGEMVDSMLVAMRSTSQPPDQVSFAPNTSQSQIRIGIVAGHWNDSNNAGFVCADDANINEQRLNLRIATLLRQKLIALGYQADLFQEHEDALFQYQAALLISIHNDTCEYQGDDASGFKVAPAQGNSSSDQANLLTGCVVDNYAVTTGLKYHPNLLTEHMTTYHDFREVNANTPVIVIETGYLNLDRQILANQSDLIAQGIVDSILCYLNQTNVAATPQATRIP